MMVSYNLHGNLYLLFAIKIIRINTFLIFNLIITFSLFLVTNYRENSCAFLASYAVRQTCHSHFVNSFTIHISSSFTTWHKISTFAMVQTIGRTHAHFLRVTRFIKPDIVNSFTKIIFPLHLPVLKVCWIGRRRSTWLLWRNLWRLVWRYAWRTAWWLLRWKLKRLIYCWVEIY